MMAAQRMVENMRDAAELLERYGEELEARLERWALWRRGCSGAGWSDTVAWLSLRGGSGTVTVPLPPNIDEEAADTDAAVCQLPTIYRVTVIVEYCAPEPQSMKAERLGIHRATYCRRLAGAHEQLAAILYGGRRS